MRLIIVKCSEFMLVCLYVHNYVDTFLIGQH